MELNYDWKSFQAVFYPQKRSLQPLAFRRSTVFAIVERGFVIAVYAEGENHSDYLGKSIQSLRSGLGNREVVALEKEKVDQWMEGATTLSHLHEQIEYFRRSVAPELGAKVRSSLQKQTFLAERHFLLDSLLGKWGKFLPSAFGVFIRLERAPQTYPISPDLLEAMGGRCREYLDQEQDILVIIRGGKLEKFYEPDLSPIGPERRINCTEVVKYLSEKHSVAVQGIVLPYIEWIAWGNSHRPWRAFASSLKSRAARLYPLRWQVTALLGFRAAAEL